MFDNNVDYRYTSVDMKKAIEDTCRSYPKDIAFHMLKSDGSVATWTFDDTFEKIKEIEEFYKQIGFKEHDRVAVLLSTTPYSAFVSYGLAYAGAILVPIDVTLPISEMERLLAYADVAGVFLMDSIYEQLPDEVKSAYPFVVQDKDYNLSLIKNGKTNARECDIYDNDPENMAILFSSGTTSKMKGVCISYRCVFNSFSKYFDLANIKDRKKTSFVLIFPFNHLSGLSLGFGYFLLGSTISMVETPDSANLLHAMRIFEPRLFGFLPKFFDVVRTEMDAKLGMAKMPVHALMDLNGFLREHFSINIGRILFKKILQPVFGSKIYFLAVGTTPCKPETEAYFWKLGVIWENLYGSTETGAPTVATGYKDKNPVGTVGRVNRFKDIEIKVVSKDIDGIGEICVKSSLMMLGYFRDPELTKKSFDDEGFFLTGDLGYIDKKKYLHITGRKKEVILMKNGKKASPEDLEKIYGEKLGDIPFVVCGVPGQDGFDEIHLFAESTDEKMFSYIQEKLSDIKGIYRVSGIHIIEKLPFTRTMKIKRNELFELLLENDKDNSPVTEKAIGHQKMSIEEIIASIVDKEADSFEDSQLLADIGIDSLSMLELVVQIEDVYNINISNQLVKIQTVGDLKRTVAFSSNSMREEDVMEEKDRIHYPVPRSGKQIRQLEKALDLLPKVYDIAVLHGEKIDANKQCILCLNHQSYFDMPLALYILKKSNITISKIAYLTAHHLMGNRFTRYMISLIGGIPIDRFVNSMPAYEDMKVWLNQGGSLVIHPEGFLSVDGSILPFKEGAAKLALEHNVPILPIRVEGTRTVLPKGSCIPKIRKNGRKIKLTIAVGDYIEPSGFDTVSLTQAVRTQILNLKDT